MFLPFGTGMSEISWLSSVAMLKKTLDGPDDVDIVDNAQERSSKCPSSEADSEST